MFKMLLLFLFVTSFAAAQRSDPMTTPAWEEAHVDKERELKEIYLFYNLKQRFAHEKYMPPRDPPVVVVTMLVVLRNIQLDEEREILTTNSIISQTWKDHRVQWNVSRYGGIKMVKYPIEDFWRPDVVPFNSIDEQATYRVITKSKATVYYDGNIWHEPQVRIQSSCPLDFYYFPFDTQTCEIIFGSWDHFSNEVDLNVRGDGIPGYSNNTNGYVNIHMINFTLSKNWDVTEAKILRRVREYNYQHLSHVNAQVVLVLKRKASLLAIIYVLPGIIFAFLVPLVFLLPPQTQQKISLSVGLLFVDALLLASLGGHLHTANGSPPVIASYYAANFFLLATSLILSVILSNLEAGLIVSLKRPPAFLISLSTVIGKLLMVPPAEPDAFGVQMTTGDQTGERVNIVSASDGDSPLPTAKLTEWQAVAIVINRILFFVYLAIIVILTIVLL